MDSQDRYDLHFGDGWKTVSGSAGTGSDILAGGAFLLVPNERPGNTAQQNREPLRFDTIAVRIEKKVESGL